MSRKPNAEASQPHIEKLALTRREAAAMLSISEPTLDRLAERGLLRPSRATRRPLYARSELERFLRDTTTNLDYLMEAISPGHTFLPGTSPA